MRTSVGCGRLVLLEQRLEALAALGQRQVAQVVVAVAQQIEGDERRRLLDRAAGSASSN